MTTLLERAIAEIKKLPSDIQDAIAARLLAELSDEVWWENQFTSTTDEQWRRMAAAARAEIDEEKTLPLEQFLSEFEEKQ
jgi:hypothetical protein